MIKLKTDNEIEVMIEGGSRLKAVVDKLRPIIKEGVTTEHIDEAAERLVRKMGGEPSFKRVKGYCWSICSMVNEQIVHTPPSGRVLKNGDVFTLDIGMYYQGYHTDYADTFVIGGRADKKKERFLRTGKYALAKAIDQAKAGNRLGQISAAIEKEIRGSGYKVIRQLTGHGIGRELHEDPFVPGFLDRPIGKTLVIKPGLTLAIEVIYSAGTDDIAYEKDGNWSIVTSDGSLSACFEHTIAVKEKETLILT
jgi:methionyl aminopeptidase